MAGENRERNSELGSQVFGTDTDTANDNPGNGTRNRSRGGEGGIRSLRDALGGRTDTHGPAENGTPGTNEPATKRRYTKRNRNNETVAAWGELIGQGLGAWTDVLAESRGNHWRIKQERLNTLGEKYAALLVHYFPETGGEMSLWGAALVATGTTLGPPLTKDAMVALRRAQAQVRNQPPRQPPPPPFWSPRPPVNQEYYEPPPPEPWAQPPPSWGSPLPGFRVTPDEPLSGPVYHGGEHIQWEPPPTTVDDLPPRPLVPSEMMPADGSEDQMDLRAIGQQMGLSPEQIDFALSMVQGMMGGES